MRFCLLAAACLLAGCGVSPDPIGASVSVAEAMAGDTVGYARADRVRAFVFPADHGPHPGFKAEWWYVTGNVRATDGSDRRFGIQFTVFRSALAPDTAQTRASGWGTSQLYMAHLAVGDLRAGRFYSAERFARGAAGLAGASAEPVSAFLGTARLAAADPDAPARGAVPLRLTGDADGATFDLTARPLKPIVLQGDRGLSQKGVGAGNASYYYAQTRMATSGTVTVGGEAIPVEGLTWLDREWSTSALGEGQVGWDWFALHLDDGRDLMLYQLRQADGAKDPLSEGSIVASDGTKTRLDAADFDLAPLDTWASPSGGSYPTRWRVRVPRAGLDLEVGAALEGQELDATIRYWEGAVDVTGSASGVGFLEMTGYADEAETARPGA